MLAAVGAMACARSEFIFRLMGGEPGSQTSSAAVTEHLRRRAAARSTLIAGLQSVLERSWELRRAAVSSEEEYTAWCLRYLEWFTQASDFLEQHVSHTAALNFRKLPAIAAASPFATGINASYRLDITTLADKHDELEKHLAFAMDGA